MHTARTRAMGTTRAPSVTPTGLLHDDLPVHPGMRRADVVVVPRLREGDGLRLAVRKHTGIPVALLPRRRPVRQVADVREVQRAARLDPDAGRHEAVLHVVAAHLDRVDAGRDRPDGPGDGRRWRRRPQRPELSLQREGPDRVTVGAALQLIAARGDHDELLAVHLVDDRRRIGAEAGLEAPERSEEHTSELQSPCNLVCRLLLEKKKTTPTAHNALLIFSALRARTNAKTISPLRSGHPVRKPTPESTTRPECRRR